MVVEPVLRSHNLGTEDVELLVAVAVRSLEQRRRLHTESKDLKR